MLSSLSPSEFKMMKSVANKYPLMKITRAKFSVLGEKVIIPSAIVTLIVKLQLTTVEQLLCDKNATNVIDTTSFDPADEIEPEKKWYKKDMNTVTAAHAPYFPEVKRPVWWVLLGDNRNGRLITMTKVSLKAGPDGATARLQFQAPPNPGRWVFAVHVKTDAFSGCDAKIDATVSLVYLILLVESRGIECCAK
jgi:translocation protein SEC63